jgi:hypothetical protein
VAIVRRDLAELADPLTLDDVLDAHEALKTWRGRLGELIAPRPTA